MRRTVPQVTCDRVDHVDPVMVDPGAPSSVITVSIAGGKPQTFSGESCDDCLDELSDGIRQLLAKFLRPEQPEKRPNRKREAPAGAPLALAPDDDDVADRKCPICHSVRKSRGALGQHLKVDHNTGFNKLGISLVGKGSKRPKRA